MPDHFSIQILAQMHQQEMLEESLREVAIRRGRGDRPKPLQRKLLVVLCCAVPIVLLIVQVVAWTH